MLYISNSFSLQMSEMRAFTEKISLEKAKEMIIVACKKAAETASEIIDAKDSYRNHDGEVVSVTAYKSIVGHADIAKIISGLLNADCPMNRETAHLGVGDILLVGQYVGPRLPEGCKTLPEGSKIEWYVVKFVDRNIQKVLDNIDKLDKAAYNLAGWGENIAPTIKEVFSEYFSENAFD